MSYEIIYRRQFIKVDDQRVIPMIEMGSNNCYESVGRGSRRARSWGSINLGGEKTLIKTNNGIIKSIDEYNESLNKDYPNYNPDSFGYYSSISFYGKTNSQTKFSTYRNFFLNGIKQAMTIEELINSNVRVSIHVYTYNRENLKNEGLQYLDPVIFKSTEHMIETIAYFENYYKDTKLATVYVTFDSEWAITNLLNSKAREKSRNRKPKNKTLVNHYFVLIDKKGNYFCKKTRYGYKYTFYLSTANKMFLTEKEAKKYIDKYGLLFNIKKVETEIPVSI